MQIYTIVIGGLEKSYMQKLVLYLNERLGKSARVELLETLGKYQSNRKFGK